MNEEYVDYETFKTAMQYITFQLKDETFDGIYAPPRGGLAMALVLSHSLKLPMLMKPTSESLVVDDIADTGNTLHNISNKKIATIYYNKQSITVPDIWVYEKGDDWIVYWWEDLR